MLSKRALFGAVMTLAALCANAQTSTNSPYTRFGLGDLCNQAAAGNSAMGGIGYGLRDNTMVNTMNPASYTAVDSITMMMDVGLSLTNSYYNEDGWRTNAKNSSFDYVVLQFRFKPWLGFAAGFRPYSQVGYYFYNTTEVTGNEDVTATNSYDGEGGLHEVFMGFGLKLLKNLSIGVNAGYLYGDIDYTAMVTFSEDSDYSVVYNELTINTYKLDFGLQYTQKIWKNHSLTLGLVYGLGHKANSSEVKAIQLTDGSSYANSQGTIYRDAYELPHTFGAGLVYNKAGNFTLGVDYELQKWSKLIYNGQKGWYNDSERFAVGLEFIPKTITKKFLERVKYRLGAYYKTPYMKIATGEKAPKEYGICAGLGFPINLYQRRSVISVTGQYVRLESSTPSLLSENRFVLKLGMTFNEHWFMKWKLN